jgi:hypothetical protein
LLSLSGLLFTDRVFIHRYVIPLIGTTLPEARTNEFFHIYWDIFRVTSLHALSLLHSVIINK